MKPACTPSAAPIFIVMALWTALCFLQPQAQAETLNIVSYGAVPDDGGDDRTAINNAIAAASAGDTVYFPVGTYRLSGAVFPKSGIRLAGTNTGGSVLRFVGGALSEIIGIGGLADVVIAHLTLDGGGGASVKDGILASGSSRLRLENLIIRNFGNAPEGPRGIRFEPDVTDSVIVSNRIENIGTGTAWGAGIRLSWRSSRNRVTDNVIANTGRGGIFCNDDATDNVILRNVVTGSGGEGLGIEVWGRCLRSLIEDNRIDHWLSVCCGSDFTAVRRNTVSDRSGLYKLCGLEFVDSRHGVFADNLVDGGAQLGISISGEGAKEYALWIRNTVQGCGSLGAQLMGQTGGCRYQYFCQNKFQTANDVQPPALYPNMGDGFRFNGNCYYVSLDGNQITNNAHDGIVSFGDVNQVSFTGNSIQYNGNGGVWDGFGGDLEWAGNIVAGNRGGGGGAAWNTQLASRGFTNRKPVAAFTAPSVVLAGQAVTFTNASSDADGSIGQVLWDFGGGLPSTLASPSFTYTTPGAYAVTLIVWDNLGRAARATKTITVLAVHMLVATGSTWKYLDTGVPPGAAWSTDTFNDTAWLAGPARLGYGGDGEVSLVASNRLRITTYFRRRFVANSTNVSMLALRLLRDDGAVVYLNGTELWRDNMPAGPITDVTLATLGVGGLDEQTFFATNLSPALLAAGTNVLAVEVHQASPTSSDLSLDLELIALPAIPANLPPTCTLSGLTNFAHVAAPITLTASADDPDGVARVEFFVDGAKLGEATTPPYSIAWLNPAPGPHAIWAVATDAPGAAASSPALTVFVDSTFIPAGAPWRYNDGGTNLGTVWRMTNYNDTTWRSGAAELGFGDNDEATVVSNRLQFTTYFRRAFTVTNATNIAALTLRLIRDDGAVVYLNGTELWRDNMPAGTISHATPAGSAVVVPDESTRRTRTTNAAALRTGPNVLAVEIHQSATNSSDISFNFELTAAATFTPATLSASVAGSQLQLTWLAWAAGLTLMTATNLSPPMPWSRMTNEPSWLGQRWQMTLPVATNGQRFFRLQAP